MAGPDAVGRSLERLVRAHYEHLHRCYRKALAFDRNAGGNVYVEIDLAKGPQAQHLRIVRDELNHPAAAACIQASMERWSFAKVIAAGASGATLRLPLSFRAAPEQQVVHGVDVSGQMFKWGGRAALLTHRNSGAKGGQLLRFVIHGAYSLRASSAIRALWVIRGKGRVFLRDRGQRERPLRGDRPVVLGSGVSARIQAAGGPLTLLVFESKQAKGFAKRPPRSQACAPRGNGLAAANLVRFRAGETYRRSACAAGEMLYVIRGQGALEIGKQPVTRVATDSAVYLKPGQPFVLRTAAGLKAVRWVLPSVRGKNIKN